MTESNTGIVYMVRHGLALNNKLNVHSGHLGGYPLVPEGRSAVEYTANWLASKGITSIHSSPIQRTLETAEIISKRCGIRPIHDSRLVEIDVGIYAGMSFDDVRAAHGDTARDFWRNTMDARGGMETVASLKERVLESIHELLYTGRTSVAVTHSWALKSIVHEVENPSPRKILRMKTGNACVMKVWMDDGLLSYKMVLDREFGIQ